MSIHCARLRTLVCVATLFPALAMATRATAAPGNQSSRQNPGANATKTELGQLPTIKVTGMRPSFELDQPGTISVIDREQMDRHLTITFRDLVRYEPGVSAIGAAGRFGLDSFNIRGLSGNRTHMEIDGVPMADSYCHAGVSRQR